MSGPVPRLSVVIPTFDRHATLAECLARLAPGAQSLDAAAYEVIVTDDAPASGTEAFLAERFPWARYTRGPSRGPAANRNHGATLARAAWIVFTDDDTLPSREWLAAYAAAAATADAGSDPDALEGRTTCAAGFGTPMHYAPVNETGGRFWSCNIAVRASRFRALGGFDAGFAVAHMEDQDLRERLRGAGAIIRFVPDAVVDHPPRRQPSGRRLGLLRRAEVRYRYKHGAPRPVRWRLLRGVIALRLGIIRSLPWSADSVRALLSLARELLTVVLHGAGWERESASEFPHPDPMRVGAERRPDGTSGTDAGLERPGRAATIGVVIPAWQRPTELARCLRAVVSQSRPPEEVVVVLRADDRATQEAARTVPVPPTVRLSIAIVDGPGVIAAMETGLQRLTTELVAFTDDDAEPRHDWIARLTAALAADSGVVGVGGRDWQPHERGDSPVVGRVQWFGRVIGRHHLGTGAARDVDVLKGVNCAFRTAALRAVGFDTRLRGAGAQVHWELATCLPLRRRGWRLRYDPGIAVEHHVAPRGGDDQVHRGRFAAAPVTDAVHNETLALIEHLSGMRALAFRCWSGLVGTTASPGLAAAFRLRAQGHAWAWDAWRAARTGRALARRTHQLAPRP